jgi:hypothetical protein
MPFWRKAAAPPVSEPTPQPSPLSLYRDTLASYEQRYLGSPYPDTPTLYDKTCDLIAAAKFPDHEKFANNTLLKMLEQCDASGFPTPHHEVCYELIGTIVFLYLGEMLKEPPPNWTTLDEIDRGRLRDILIRMHVKLERPDHTLDVIQRTLIESFTNFTRILPAIAHEHLGYSEEAPTVPLLDVIPNIGEAVQLLIGPFFSAEAKALDLFRDLRAQLTENIERSSPKGAVMPADAEGEPRMIVRTYLQNTRLDRLFETRIPFEIPLSRRFEHTVIVAGSGHGKTQLLQSIIAADLEKENPPAMIVLDSTGAMIDTIQRLKVFSERLKDRIVIVDPEQIPAPALNPFEIPTERMAGYTQNIRESIEAEVVDLFGYVFSSIAREMTGRQSGAWSYIVRLVLSIPNADIHTLRELLADHPREKFAPYIEKLDDVGKQFFESFFYQKNFIGVRTQVLERLLAVLRIPAFNRMFSNVNKVDLFTEMERGSIVLVNTSRNLLKEHSALFGRYIIARTMAAAFERAAIPEKQRKPAFLVIDEASAYTDQTIETLLTKVRQFKLGVVLAYQHLDHKEFDDAIRSALYSSTSIKYVGGASYTDQRRLAREMNTTPEFIAAQKKDSSEPPKYTRFACYVRNYSETAISLTVPIGGMEAMAKMSEQEFAVMGERNRARVSAPMQSAPGIDGADQPKPHSPEIEAAPLASAAAPERKLPNAPRDTKATDRPKPPLRDPDTGTEGASDWR